MTTPPLVLVRWHDAWCDPDISSVAEIRTDYLVESYGVLLDSPNPAYIVLVAEVLPDGEGYRGVTGIPQSVVESITPLQELVEELRNGHASGTPTDITGLGPTSFEG